MEQTFNLYTHKGVAPQHHAARLARRGRGRPATAGAWPAGAQPVATDYDASYNAPIDVSALAQLDSMRYDLDGDGDPASTTPYAAAFLDRATAARTGCPAGNCGGYKLMTNLTFATSAIQSTYARVAVQTDGSRPGSSIGGLTGVAPGGNPAITDRYCGTVASTLPNCLGLLSGDPWLRLPAPAPTRYRRPRTIPAFTKTGI